MNYKDIFEILSQCGLGALLLSGDGKILDINAIGISSSLETVR